MGTYAVYQVWVGWSNQVIAQHELRSSLEKLLLSKARQFRFKVGTEKKGLEIISMHGEEIGIGVVAQELDWSSELSPENEFDFAVAERVRDIQLTIKNNLPGLGEHVKVYHHLDLGG